MYPTATTKFVCPFKPVGGDRSKYLQDRQVMECPSGTLYNAKKCGCLDRKKVVVNG